MKKQVVRISKKKVKDLSVNKSNITDRDIENWADQEVNKINPDDYGYGDLLIYGAMALRDNKIKHNE